MFRDWNKQKHKKIVKIVEEPAVVLTVDDFKNLANWIIKHIKRLPTLTTAEVLRNRKRNRRIRRLKRSECLSYHFPEWNELDGTKHWSRDKILHLASFYVLTGCGFIVIPVFWNWFGNQYIPIIEMLENVPEEEESERLNMYLFFYDNYIDCFYIINSILLIRYLYLYEWWDRRLEMSEHIRPAAPWIFFVAFGLIVIYHIEFAPIPPEKFGLEHSWEYYREEFKKNVLKPLDAMFWDGVDRSWYYLSWTIYYFLLYIVIPILRMYIWHPIEALFITFTIRPFFEWFIPFISYIPQWKTLAFLISIFKRTYKIKRSFFEWNEHKVISVDHRTFFRKIVRTVVIKQVWKSRFEPPHEKMYIVKDDIYKLWGKKRREGLRKKAERFEARFSCNQVFINKEIKERYTDKIAHENFEEFYSNLSNKEKATIKLHFKLIFKRS